MTCRCRTLKTVLAAAFIAASLNGCASPTAQESNEIAHVRGDVRFTQLSDTTWMHSSDDDVPGFGKVVSHGLIVVDGDHAILVDSGWTDAQTTQILDWAAHDLGKPVAQAVFTHAHADKMGGVGAIRARGIATYALPLSNELAAKRGLVPAENDLALQANGAAMTIGPVSLFYPGGGHTEDNIVAYVDDGAILFGGCLIRPGESSNLGNVADANIDHWAEAVRSVAAAYPNAKIVLPSHGPPGGRELLDHSIALAEAVPPTRSAP